MALLCAQLAFAVGCASRPYRYGEFSAEDDPVEREVTFKYGQPHKTLDRMSDVVSWPGRALRPELPDRRLITTETTQKLARYLEKNDLADVQVEVRDYDPGEQWRRLRDNRVLPPVSRYSLGTLSVLRYSLFPGRVFGRNAYNPYTNTLFLNSESQALILHEAAFAKNLRSQRVPGVYAVASHLPFLATWHEIDGASEVVAYAQTEDDWELEEASYREIYPRVGSQATGGATAFVPVWWGGPLLGLAGTAAGGVAGRMSLGNRERERDLAANASLEEEVTGSVQQASHSEPVKPAPGRRYVTPSNFEE